METQTHSNGTKTYPKFTSFPVPNNQMGTKVGDIAGFLDRAISSLQALPGYTPEIGQACYNGLLTFWGGVSAASGKVQSNA